MAKIDQNQPKSTKTKNGYQHSAVSIFKLIAIKNKQFLFFNPFYVFTGLGIYPYQFAFIHK